MNEVRKAFLEAAEVSRSLLASPQLADRWEQPSVLELFTNKGLAGHLHRATGSVLAYLDREEPDGPAISAAVYYNTATGGERDLASELNVGVRAKGEQEAAGGHASLLANFDAVFSQLKERLEQEPPERLVRVFMDMVLALDDYLKTRLVELAVHIDDLALSLDLPTPAMPPAATDIAIHTLVDIGRLRHGEIAVLRALARRERDDVEALRVI